MNVEVITQMVKNNSQGVNVVVKGFSMKPFIFDGDKIKIKFIEAKKIKFGDIVVFKSNEKLVVHRIIRTIERHDLLYFWEKGDNRRFPTEINENDLVGKVVEIERSGKIVSLISVLERFKGIFFGLVSYFSYLLRRFRILS
ncbi:signal peptidase I [bacterium]|nr:signal peptidase I [bacterium]